jgi:hypothetical protein
VIATTLKNQHEANVAILTTLYSEVAEEDYIVNFPTERRINI